jgi:hypothetical protein
MVLSKEPMQAETLLVSSGTLTERKEGSVLVLTVAVDIKNINFFLQNKLP